MGDLPPPQPDGQTGPAGGKPPVSSSTESPAFKGSIEDLSASLSQEIETLASELRACWRRGDRITVESLGPVFERIALNEELLLDLVYHEMLIREEFGETPGLDEYLARFPQHGERLRRLFAVHGAIEEDWDNASPSDGDGIEDSPSGNQQSRQRPSSTDWGDGDKPAQWPRKLRSRRPVEPPPGYELLEEIGRGGMAVVFRARQQILNRVVALKMLLAGSVVSKEVLARLQQEARVVAQLQHPGIVQIYEVGEHRGSPFLSLEYVAGGTLHEWLDGQPLPPLEAARIVEQLARTVQFAHERGIVHRDLKPSNVLLVERPANAQSIETIPMHETRAGGSSPPAAVATRISDFGLARVLGSRSDLTATGQVLGTPSYMAPEQTSSKCDASPAQDIYSLGAILYELLTGRPPFRGSTLFETLEQVRSSDPVPPRRLQPRVPRDLETICLKCLEKPPVRRYATALALADDLRAVQQGNTITARPAGPIERTWKLLIRHPSVSSLAALAALAALAGVAGIWQEARRANRSEAAARNDRDAAIRLRIAANRERDQAEEQRELAVQQTREAEQQKRRADEQRGLAEAARAHAQELQLAAEANLDHALNAIDSLARFGAELQHQPRQQTISRRILDDTLNLYTRLEAEHGDNPRLRRQLAATLIRTGEIRSILRDNDKADELLRRAIAILDEELKDNPSDVQLLGLVASAAWLRGNLLRSIERPREALDAYRQSVAARNALLAVQPGDPNQLIAKANTLVNESVALLQLGRHPETLPRYEEAISILRAVLSRLPTHLNAQSELSLALHDYSRIVRMMQRADDAQQAFREAFSIRKRLHRQDPNSVMNRVMLARLHTSQGFFDREMHELSNGIAQFQQAIPLLEGLVESYPGVYDHHRDLHTALIGQVEICLLAGNAAVGKPAWQDLAGRLQAARAMFPQDKLVASRVVDWLPGWGEQLWEDGQQDGARKLHQVALDSALWLLGVSLPASAEKEALLANDAAWLLATSLDTGKRDFPQAKGLAQRAVQLAPENAACLQTLGTVLLRLGEPAVAKEILSRAVALEKRASNRSPFATLTQALLELPRGNAEAAREGFETSVGYRKQSQNRLPVLYATLAVAQAMLDEQQAAQATFSLVVDPPHNFSRNGSQARRLIQESRAMIGPMADD